MIPYDWIYCRPDTLSEASAAYVQFQSEGLSPVYYSGGSEVITMSRACSIRPGAVVDLKSIPECLELEQNEDKLVIGAANTLGRIKDSKLFALLGTACGRIADHTNQCRITLGGNLCGTIIYRETSLPLMLCDAQILLFGPEGMRCEAFNNVFFRRMHLAPGEFVVQIHIPSWALNAPYIHVKKTAQEKIDYPLVNVTALRAGEEIRVAFSGLCAFPFRSRKIARVLCDRSLSCEARVEAVAGLLPEKAHTDVEGSGEYRLFVLKNTLLDLLEEWKFDSI
jgi:CO/xanthine dehydrogenase FAD-binding subunit